MQQLQIHNKALSYTRIRKFKSPIKRKYTLKFDHLVLTKGMLHQTYRQDKLEYHKLLVPPKFRQDVLKMLHDEQGHQMIN